MLAKKGQPNRVEEAFMSRSQTLTLTITLTLTRTRTRTRTRTLTLTQTLTLTLTLTLTVVEARGRQMEAYQREAGKAAAKLESAKTELTEFESRVCTLTEVRRLSFFTVSDVLLRCLTLPIVCRHCRQRQ